LPDLLVYCAASCAPESLMTRFRHSSNTPVRLLRGIIFTYRTCGLNRVCASEAWLG